MSGNELVGSLWVLLLSLAALRTGGLTRALNYLGVVLGIAGILTMIPALADDHDHDFRAGHDRVVRLGGNRHAAPEHGVAAHAIGGHVRAASRTTTLSN